MRRQIRQILSAELPQKFPEKIRQSVNKFRQVRNRTELKDKI